MNKQTDQLTNKKDCNGTAAAAAATISKNYSSRYLKTLCRFNAPFSNMNRCKRSILHYDQYQVIDINRPNLYLYCRLSILTLESMTNVITSISSKLSDALSRQYTPNICIITIQARTNQALGWTVRLHTYEAIPFTTIHWRADLHIYKLVTFAHICMHASLRSERFTKHLPNQLQ